MQFVLQVWGSCLDSGLRFIFGIQVWDTGLGFVFGVHVRDSCLGF